MHRRAFVKQVALAGIYLQIPWYIGCMERNKSQLEKYINRINSQYKPLNETQKNNAIVAQQILFPDEPNSPGAIELNAFQHFLYLLSDTARDPSVNNFLIHGLDKLNQAALDAFQTDFYKAKPKPQVELFIFFAKEHESWASSMLSIILEALIANPIYHVNTDESGWKWLPHQPGLPQPTASQRYYELTKKRKQENIIITSNSDL